MTVVSNYGLRQNIEYRVSWLTAGMRYIYPSSVGVCTCFPLLLIALYIISADRAQDWAARGKLSFYLSLVCSYVRQDDIVDNSKPYMAEGISSTLSNAFFKGSPPVASKYSELFRTNEDGNIECPAAMIALAATAVSLPNSDQN